LTLPEAVKTRSLKKADREVDFLFHSGTPMELSGTQRLFCRERSERFKKFFDGLLLCIQTGNVVERNSLLDGRTKASQAFFQRFGNS
jgi:hypothetical protein